MPHLYNNRLKLSQPFLLQVFLLEKNITNMNILALILSFVPLVFGADDALYIAAAAAIIGGLTTAGVGVANSIKAKKAKRAADRTFGNLSAENASNYYSDYYRGALENDSTRAYLKRLDAAMKRNNRALDNTIVSTGATQENSLAQKQAKNAVMSDAMGQAVSAEDARRDRIRNNYFTRKSQLDQAKTRNDQLYSAQQQQNLSTIASGVSQAASSFASLYGGGGTAAAAGAANTASSGYIAPRADLNRQMYGTASSNLAGTTYAKYGGKVPPITLR